MEEDSGDDEALASGCEQDAVQLQRQGSQCGESEKLSQWGARWKE